MTSPLPRGPAQSSRRGQLRSRTSTARSCRRLHRPRPLWRRRDSFWARLLRWSSHLRPRRKSGDQHTDALGRERQSGAADRGPTGGPCASRELSTTRARASRDTASFRSSRKAEALSRRETSAKPGLLAVGEGCVPQFELSSPPSWVPWRDDTVQIPARSTPRLARRSVERCRGHATGACAASASLRYWWTNAMHMLPSPTAAATRLTGPNRTSPQAKIPGTLVSRR